MPRLLALAAGLGLALAARAQPAPPAALDSLVVATMDEVGIVGVGAAVLVRGEVVWSGGYGFADVRRTRPFTPHTAMPVGSIAKTVTGVAMMRAVQEGRLSLDADVSAHLPFRVANPHHPDAPITLRHLATHTSGITDRWEVYRDAYRYGADAPEPLGAFLAAYLVPGGAHYATANFLDARPGTVRDYSNIGAALAGYVVERAVGESLPAYTRRHVFEPLGMTHTGWSDAEIAPGALSTLFAAQDGVAIPIQPYTLTTYPDGALRTSVADLARFFAALLGDGAYRDARILDAASTAEMTRFQFSDANRPVNFPAADGNSGLFWRTKFSGTRVGHGGNDPGLATEMLADLTGEIGVILFVNTSLAGPDGRAVGVLFDAFWRHAEALHAAGPAER